MYKLIAIIFAMVLMVSLTACGGPPSLVGNWMADDGTGMKVIRSNGACSGMYYSRGEPLDIGGPMSCSIGTKKDGNGRYSLVVTQPPNEQTLKFSFSGDDEVAVYSGGDLIFTMTRQ